MYEAALHEAEGPFQRILIRRSIRLQQEGRAEILYQYEHFQKKPGQVFAVQPSYSVFQEDAQDILRKLFQATPDLIAYEYKRTRPKQPLTDCLLFH